MNNVSEKNKWILDDIKWTNFFSITNWKKEGGIIMLISLLIPLITSLLFALLNGGAFNGNGTYSILQMLITIGSSIAALLFASRTKFFKEYKIIFFWSNTAFFFLTMLIGPLSNFVDIVLLGVIFQTVYQIIVIILAFMMIHGFRENVLDGFKNGWITIIAATIIAVPLMYLWTWGMSEAGLGESENQNSIESLLNLAHNDVSKVFMFILIFMFVVLAAPIFEEMIARYFIAVFCGNRWVTLAISTLVFATMHTTMSGDFMGLPIYIFGSFIMSLAFTLFGSLGHSITIHITWNLISFITIVVANN